MAWCPLCKSEYVDGIDVCVDCGTILTNEKPDKSAEPVNPIYTDATMKPIMNIGSKLEADFVKGMLIDEDINAHCIQSQIGSLAKVYTGSNPSGYDIYVPEDSVEGAMNILSVYIEQCNGEDFIENPEMQANEDLGNYKDYESILELDKSGEGKKGIAAVLLLIILIFLIFMVINNTSIK